jgi:4-amino-4-deoxy-L-arabinose transferase-like glycosyltransferase
VNSEAVGQRGRGGQRGRESFSGDEQPSEQPLARKRLPTPLPENGSRPRGCDWQVLALLLVLAVVVRGSVLVAGWDRFQDDPDGYRQLAVNLLEYGTFGQSQMRDGQIQHAPTAYRPPVYPLVLAAFGFATGVDTASVAILHLLLGVATVLLVVAVAAPLYGWRVAGAAGVLVTFDPILLNQSVLVMTETIAAFLAVLAWWLLIRCGRPFPCFAAGLVLAVAALCRPVSLIWLGLAALVVLASSVKRRAWREPAGFCLAAAVVLVPWALRNAYHFGRPIVTTTHGGYTIWLGNNQDYYDFLKTAPRGSVWDSAELDERYSQVRNEFGADEVAADRWANQQAKQCIQRQPAMFVRACIGRVARLWGLVPNRLSPDESVVRRTARWGVALWYSAIFVLVLFAAFCLRRQLLRSPWHWAVLLAIALTGVHCAYWTDMRMRAPIIPMLCVAAAWGAVRWYEGIWKVREK